MMQHLKLPYNMRYKSFIPIAISLGLCIFIVTKARQKYLEDRISKEAIASFSLDGDIYNEIKTRSALLSKSNNLANYSVLTDNYYVFDINSKNKEAIFCNESAKSKLVRYFFCYKKMDFLCEKALESGIWQWRAFGLMLRALQRNPGSAFIDVGAHNGLMSIPLASIMGPTLKVIVVEALTVNAHSVAKGVLKNKFPISNWAIINRALTNELDSKVEFRFATSGASHGSLGSVPDPFGYFQGNRTMVLTATFDSQVLPVAQAMNITTAIMKMDIDGSECVAMKSAEQFLTKINVLYIVMEAALRLKLQDSACLENMFSMLHEFAYVPFTPDSIGIKSILDYKSYQSWPYEDIIWKKIV